MESGDAPEIAKKVAATLVATLQPGTKLSPAAVPASVTSLRLGDTAPELAEVGWLKPASNRVPTNTEMTSPLLDSGKIYTTGLYAHAPSRYVFNLAGKWNRLRGEAGLHTALHNRAYGVVFVIKTDGHEVFRSSPIRGATRPRYNLDVTGVKTLELIVEKAVEQNGGNWGLWLDPTLSR